MLHQSHTLRPTAPVNDALISRQLSMFYEFLPFFFFNDTATTEIYTLSLHDALPISTAPPRSATVRASSRRSASRNRRPSCRSEEHTSELQSQSNLVCRLLLEKKKNTKQRTRCWHYNSSPAPIGIKSSPSHTPSAIVK